MSLFGRTERRENTRLKADKQRLIDQVEALREDLRTAQFNAKSKLRQNEHLADDNDRLRKEAADLGRMLTRETVEAVEDINAEQARAGRYLAAWRSARTRAARHFDGLNSECVDHLTTLRERNALRDETERLRAGGDAELRRRLDLSERARASLVAQLETVQRVNESLNAEGAMVADQVWRRARQAKAGDVS